MPIPMDNDSSNLPPEETNGSGTPIITSARVDMATEDRNQAHDARPRQRITSSLHRADGIAWPGVAAGVARLRLIRAPNDGPLWKTRRDDRSWPD